MNLNFDHAISLITDSVNNLENLSEFEDKLAKLDEINGLIINFLSEINNLPQEDFLKYNQQLLEMKPKLEQAMNKLIEDKQRLKDKIQLANLSKKVSDLYEDA